MVEVADLVVVLALKRITATISYCRSTQAHIYTQRVVIHTEGGYTDSGWSRRQRVVTNTGGGHKVVYLKRNGSRLSD